MRHHHVQAGLVLAVALAACGKSGAKDKPAPPAPPIAVAKASLAITNVRVFDGERALATNVDVAIDGGTIVAVGPHLALPPNTVVVDGTGRTLLPGLFDAHAHVSDASQLEQALAFGVTTVLDMFAIPDEIKKIKADDQPSHAELRSAGICATAPGGHGTEYGFEIPTITKPEDAQAFVDARIAEGSDYLKIIYDDGSAYLRDKPNPIPSIDAATMTALVTAAHARHILAMVHIGDYDEARTAFASGADGIVHLFRDVVPPDDFGATVAKAHGFVTATLDVLRTLQGGTSPIGTDPELGPYLSPTDKANLVGTFPIRAKATPDAAETALRQLVAANVPVLVGTDAPNQGTTYGASVHDELELLVTAGVPPAVALAGATARPADVFGMTDRGRIAAGKRADLVLVEGDPTSTITDTRRIVSIWRGGVKFDRAAYKLKIDEAVATAAEPIKPGPISDFEDGTLAVTRGSPWDESTDSYIGGKSTVKLELVDGGAASNKHALRLTGAVVAGAKGNWAGALYMPGPAAFAPMDLSQTKALAFTVKRGAGTGGVAAMVFTTAGGFVPAVHEVAVGAKPAHVAITWKDFGIDGTGVTAIFIGRQAPGPFELTVDDVAFE